MVRPLSTIRSAKLAASGLILVSAMLGAGNAAAQDRDQRQHMAQARDAKPVEAQAAPKPQTAPQQGIAIPDPYRLNMMIRSTILALNQANLTGNYTVLKDMGAPGFQFANNASRLSEIFAPMRLRKLDLTPILFYNPQLVREPAIQDGRFLRLTGFFATKPEQVNFDLAFQAFGGQWMLAGIAVNTKEAGPAANPGKTSVLPEPPSAAAAKPSSAAASETSSLSGGAKPVRIDLGEPAPMPKRRPHKAQPRSASASPQPAKAATEAESSAAANPDKPAEGPDAQASGGGWRPR
jgi:hypothetical protein